MTEQVEWGVLASDTNFIPPKRLREDHSLTMLTHDLKNTIQTAYRSFLSNRGLHPRFGQKLMIAEIARTLGNVSVGDASDEASDKPVSKADAATQADIPSHIAVIEAGTGTGKTVAYLLSTIPIAKARKKKLVIATATVALQEQVVHKDLPEVANHAGLEFSFQLAKGRSRYLCVSKLDRLLSDADGEAALPMPNLADFGGLDLGEPVLGKSADRIPSKDVTELESSPWLQETLSDDSRAIYEAMMKALGQGDWDGDKDSWPESLESQDWQRVTTDHRQCTGRRCSYVGSCSFFKARDNLNKVDVIVANHDLVLADLALGGGAILPTPEDTFYVFDEGHHLPDKAIDHFACHGRLLATNRWLDQSHKALGEMLGAIGEAGNIERHAEGLPAELVDAHQKLQQLWPELHGLVPIAGEGFDAPRHRFPNGEVSASIREQADSLEAVFGRISRILGKMLSEVEYDLEDGLGAAPKADLEIWYPILGSWAARAESAQALWQSYAKVDVDGSVPLARWLTRVDMGSHQDVEVCSSPILSSSTLRHALWETCAGAVITSATLTALGKFERFRYRAGTPDNTHYAVVPSPFDFSRGLLQVPDQAEDASKAREHTDAVVAALPQLLAPSEGSLVLFSSRRQMRDVFEQLPSSWQSKILMQGEQSKQAMLMAHKARIGAKKGSILFGLASFAEGVDLPGDLCRHVVIAKIPFAVPDDPVEAALSEWIESRGGNPFMEIAVPDASIKLVQACGRLLRNEADSGTITILDNRMVTRRYGKAMLNSLPPFRQLLSAPNRRR